MPFALRLERAPPPLSSEDTSAVALSFLRKVGVVSEGYDPLSEAGGGPEGSAPVRVLVDCFLREPDGSWSVAELARATRIPAGQVYRAVWKMQALDWLSDAGRPAQPALAGRRFQLRFGRLQDAWSFTELAAGHCLARYAALAKAIEERVKARRGAPAGPEPRGKAAESAGRGEFLIALTDAPLPRDGAPKDLAVAFLHATGLIPERTGGRKPVELPSFRVFFQGFLLQGDRWQDFAALSKVAGSTRPTLQKHLRRLEGLDLVERAAFPDENGFPRRHWRLRQGSLVRAFEFTDARARLSLESMGRWAAHLDALAAADRERAKKARPRRRG